MTTHERPFGRCLEDFVVGETPRLRRDATGNGVERPRWL